MAAGLFQLEWRTEIPWHHPSKCFPSISNCGYFAKIFRNLYLPPLYISDKKNENPMQAINHKHIFELQSQLLTKIKPKTNKKKNSTNMTSIYIHHLLELFGTSLTEPHLHPRKPRVVTDSINPAVYTLQHTQHSTGVSTHPWSSPAAAFPFPPAQRVPCPGPLCPCTPVQAETSSAPTDTSRRELGPTSSWPQHCQPCFQAPENTVVLTEIIQKQPNLEHPHVKLSNLHA